MKALKVIISSGLAPYEQALNYQLKCLERRKSGEESMDVLWLLSHQPVITFGASKTSESNLLAPLDIPQFKVSRGGDITYHDPGQLTAYLIFALGENERNLHRFLEGIEDSIISTLKDGGLEPSKVKGRTGVFVEGKKVCSIGIACRHWISYHGFSLNFTSDMSVYSKMNPCGLESSIMANLSEISDYDRSQFLLSYPNHCASTFGRSIEQTLFIDSEALLAND